MKGHVGITLEFDDYRFVMKAYVAEHAFEEKSMQQEVCNRCEMPGSKYRITYGYHKVLADRLEEIESAEHFLCSDCARILFEIEKIKDNERREVILMGKEKEVVDQIKFDITKSKKGPLLFNEERLPDCGCERGKIEVAATFYFFGSKYPHVAIGFCLEHFKELEKRIVKAFSKFKEG